MIVFLRLRTRLPEAVRAAAAHFQTKSLLHEYRVISCISTAQGDGGRDAGKQEVRHRICHRLHVSTALPFDLFCWHSDAGVRTPRSPDVVVYSLTFTLINTPLQVLVCADGSAQRRGKPGIPRGDSLQWCAIAIQTPKRRRQRKIRLQCSTLEHAGRVASIQRYWLWPQQPKRDVLLHDYV